MTDSHDGARRIVGFALFGSAGLIGLIAALILAGIIVVADESQQSVGLILGGVALLDAVLGLYFVLSS
jgi:hypothetical protein